MSAPESGEINLNLARLAAKEAEPDDAVLYYHNALYGVWPRNEMTDQRRKVRTELVRFFLDRGDVSQAVSELLILSSDIPHAPQAHDDVGRLFLEAGDIRQAREQFTRALRLNPQDRDALKGAGEAAFRSTDYENAQRYLEDAVASGVESTETSEMLEITKLVLSRDPLAARLAVDERIRRLIADLDFAADELQDCINSKPEAHQSQALLTSLQGEIKQGMDTRFRPANLRHDAEQFATGLDLIHRIETAAGQICQKSSPVHRALLLIANRHAGATP